ncbi:MAG: hypothetical protein M3301_01970, partial [Chloroflexota bacterium]|nr:hypothetical protein [Chloroflexota bacterium]
LPTFRAHRETWQARAAAIRAELAALEFLRPVTAFGPTVIDRGHFFDLTAEGYFAAIDDLGAPVEGTASTVRGAPPRARLAADGMVARLFGSRLDPVPATKPPRSSRAAPPLAPSAARVVAAGNGCATFVAEGNDARIEARVPGGAAVQFASDGPRPTRLFYRLFGDTYQEAGSRTFFAVPNRWYRVALPVLPEGAEWRLRLDPPDGSTRTEVCVT